MSDADPRIEAYFAKKGKWHDELKALRAILRDTDLTETFKWRSPCYTFEDANVATIWRMKESCGLSFFKGVLLKDEKDILVAPGENSRSVRLKKFTSVSDIDKLKSTLKAYVREAIAIEKAGLKVAFTKDDLDYPEELTAALRNNAKLKAAFEALTPGRRRGYVLHFSQAKQAATRTSRIEKATPHILAGKGMHDR